MKTICVYCGASPGVAQVYIDATRQLASSLVENQIDLVYGGGKTGLMGILADEVLRLGGQVTGVIPQALVEKEVAHHGLQNLHIVRNMHERKAMMAQLSDAFIALPGGIGTLEELFEMFTWLQLGFHNKPLAILNVDGYYDQLLSFLQNAVSTGFLKQVDFNNLIHTSDTADLVLKLQQFKALNFKQELGKDDL